ncbi:MAG: maleylpyruvate isomerase N-terminal domain-containing protein [Chloroflexota bacterium]|nr:maleylpyruvate isomerase N-terminal domain-containing protein [Chloroflexota bacterium]
MREAIGALPAPRWDEKLPAGWTLKEMVGHLAYWESTVPAFVDSLRTDTPREAAGDVDAQNARAAAEVRGLLPDEVLRRWDDAHSEMLEVARGLTDAELADDAFMKKFEDETYGHYPDHYGDLAAAIKDEDDLVAIVQTSWTGFRLAIGAIGVPSLDEKTSTGWTYKDLVAHVVGWMGQTVREMQTKEFSTGWTQSTIQEFNDRSVRTHELVGPEAMIDELDTVYRRLVETVRGLAEGDVDEKIAGTMPYYTYLHWEEHFAELGIPL